METVKLKFDVKFEEIDDKVVILLIKHVIPRGEKFGTAVAVRRAEVRVGRKHPGELSGKISKVMTDLLRDYVAKMSRNMLIHTLCQDHSHEEYTLSDYNTAQFLKDRV